MSESEGRQSSSNAEVTRLSTELPIARVKRIMKIGEGVKMVSNDASLKLAYAVDMILADITKLAWSIANQNNRRTFLKWDIQEALIEAEHLDFLIDIVPTNETRQQKKEKKPTGTQENYTQQIINKMQIPPSKLIYMHIMKDLPIMPQQQHQQYIRIQPAQPTYQFLMNPDQSGQLLPVQSQPTMFATAISTATQAATTTDLSGGQQPHQTIFAANNGYGQMILLNQNGQNVQMATTPTGQILQAAPPQIMQTSPRTIILNQAPPHQLLQNGQHTKTPNKNKASNDEPQSKKVKIS